MIYYFSIELRHAKLHHLIDFNTSRCTLITTYVHVLKELQK